MRSLLGCFVLSSLAAAALPQCAQAQAIPEIPVIVTGDPDQGSRQGMTTLSEEDLADRGIINATDLRDYLAFTASSAISIFVDNECVSRCSINLSVWGLGLSDRARGRIVIHDR